MSHKLYTDLHVVNTFTTLEIDAFLEKFGFAKHLADSPLVSSRFVYSKEYPENNKIAEQDFNYIVSQLESMTDFIGYVELEKIIDEWVVQDYEDYIDMELPNLTQYKTQKAIVGKYKKMDMHFRANKIDSRLADFLLSLGCYYLDFTDKAKQNGGMHRVFTLQFYDPAVGRRFYDDIVTVIKQTKGFVGKIQLEPTLKYWRKDDYDVPPCVYTEEKLI